VRIYGPFVALSVTLIQATAPPRHLAAMLAAQERGRLLTAAPLGTALGGARSRRRWARGRRWAPRESPPSRSASSRASCC
jgi:hypothetical protein